MCTGSTNLRGGGLVLAAEDRLENGSLRFPDDVEMSSVASDCRRRRVKLREHAWLVYWSNISHLRWHFHKVEQNVVSDALCRQSTR